MPVLMGLIIGVVEVAVINLLEARLHENGFNGCFHILLGLVLLSRGMNHKWYQYLFNNFIDYALLLSLGHWLLIFLFVFYNDKPSWCWCIFSPARGHLITNKLVNLQILSTDKYERRSLIRYRNSKVFCAVACVELLWCPVNSHYEFDIMLP